jgi:hypothetical protein
MHVLCVFSAFPSHNREDTASASETVKNSKYNVNVSSFQSGALEAIDASDANSEEIIELARVRQSYHIAVAYYYS